MRAGTPGAIAAAAALAAGLLAGCLDAGADKAVAGFVSAADGPFGPRVVFEPLKRPVPEVPFPSDLLLTPQGGSLSGAVWNLSTDAPTRLERRIRGMLDRLDGFGPFGPSFVSFDGPLDLTTVTDETVLLVNIEEGHPREGEVVPLDLGKGFFPGAMRPTGYWPHDLNAGSTDLLYPDDNVADTDGDGVPERVTWYEVATNTLTIRPVLPLAGGATHAVLITRGVKGWAPGEDGEPVLAPVRSPFPYKAHAAQAPLVARALELVGLDREDLAFGWTYTVADVAQPMINVREGIHGRGPLARLADAFPPRIGGIHDQTVVVDGDTDGDDIPDDPRDNVFIVQARLMSDLFGLIQQVIPKYGLPSFHNVDYFVFGHFDTPDLRTGEARTVGVNLATGEGEVGAAQVPFVVTVPKTTPEHQPPFPVMLYFHGTATSRMEVLAIADALARQGIAALSFDQVGHGPLIPDIPLALAKDSEFDPSLVGLVAPALAELFVPERVDEFRDLYWYDALDKMAEIGLWREFAFVGRTEDENGDGALESSESFFFADPFRQCASFWQDLSDAFLVVRALRSLDPAAVPPAVDDPPNASLERLTQNMLAGDFNADGVLDIGGPDVQLSVAGTSLGGFHAALAAALEPEITVATPIVAGGGLGDIMVRSKLKDVTSRIFLEVFGPLVVGCPDGEGGVWLSFNDDTDTCRKALLESKSFAHLEDTPPGTLFELTNTDNGEHGAAFLDAAAGFSVAVASDRWDQLEVRVTRPDGEVSVVPALTPYEGTAFNRNSTRFRRFLGISQHVLDRCDPINVARHLFIDPLPGHPPTNVMFEFALGDQTVPISTGVMLALAAGTLGVEMDDWREVMDTLIGQGVMVGSDYDVEDLLGDNPPGAPGLGPLPPVPTGTGVSAARFADVDGFHEWIADVDQDRAFDPATYSQSQIVLYHLSGGRAVVDDVCINKLDCPILEDPTPVLAP